jgi:hypothetical protein
MLGFFGCEAAKLRIDGRPSAIGCRLFYTGPQQNQLPLFSGGGPYASALLAAFSYIEAQFVQN